MCDLQEFLALIVLPNDYLGVIRGIMLCTSYESYAF